MNVNALVFDCETVPIIPVDPDTPLKPVFQRVVAIAGAWIAPGGALLRLTALGDLSWSEAEIVQEFFRIVGERHPQLVGWNSGGFDLPILVYRAMAHGIAAPAFYQHGEPYHGYRKRFDEVSHLDLMDVLSFYGASPRAKLDEVAQALEIPGKIGVDGKQVAELYAAGDLATIRAYCETDVLTTALIYSRYALHRGWWSDEQFATFEHSVAAFLDTVSGTQWDQFRSVWHPATQRFGRSPPAAT